MAAVDTGWAVRVGCCGWGPDADHTLRFTFIMV